MRSGRLGLSLLPVVAWRLLLATALAVAVAALAAWLLAGRLTAPLGRLVTAARRVGDGDLSTRVQVDGDGEIAEVASAFNDMATGLERAQGEQRAFLASVGHELKTPLTTVQGYTEALLDGTVDDPADAAPLAGCGSMPRRSGWPGWSRTCSTWPGWAEAS